MEKQTLIYKLEGINPENGVDIYEIIPVLENLGLLIKEAGKIKLQIDDIEVKIKPFKAGSFQIDLLIGELVNLLSSDSVSALSNLVGLIATGLGVINFVKGKVNQFMKKNNGQIAYFSQDESEIAVGIDTHHFIQNENTQRALYGAVTIPLSKISGVDGISFQDSNCNVKKIDIQKEDLDALIAYNSTELEDESNLIESKTIAYLKPARGSYSGEEKQYTFLLGNTRLHPVAIRDESFLEKLKKGDVRLFQEDLLMVELVTKQKVSKRTGRLTSEYTIAKVLEYESSASRLKQPPLDSDML